MNLLIHLFKSGHYFLVPLFLTLAFYFYLLVHSYVFLFAKDDILDRNIPQSVQKLYRRSNEIIFDFTKCGSLQLSV